MFDFLQNLRKTAEEKRQETVAAYLDGALHGRSRQQFEQEMAQDAALRQEVEQLLLIKQRLRQLPQRDVPRNFILDPAAYGRPARQPWVQAYPVLRTATALAAFFFIFAIAAGIFTTAGSGNMAMAPAADVAQVEVTRVVTETIETEAFEAAPAAEAERAEEPADESAAEESALVEEVETMEVAAEEAMEDAVEEAAEEPLPAISATQMAPLPEGSTEETASEDEDGEGAVPAPQETREAQPTPSTPRVTPPTPLPDRVEESDTVAEAPETIDETESAETTAVLPEETVRETRVPEPVNTLFWLQVGLGALLLLLVGFTFYARRQR